MNLVKLQQQFNPALRLCQKEGVKVMAEKRYREIMNILQKSEATHNERLFLTGFLKWIGFTAEEVMDIIDKHNQWLNYNPGISWYQVCSIFKVKAKMPRGARRRSRRKLTLPLLPITIGQRKRMQRMKNWIAHMNLTGGIVKEIVTTLEPDECDDLDPIFQNGFLMGYEKKGEKSATPH